MAEENPNTELDTKALEGVTAELIDDASRTKAVELAFDYRGDVTLRTTARDELVGYVFDRKQDATPATLRIMLADTGEKKSLAYNDLAAVVFTGRDCAAGKSWETWVRKYAEKKARGEAAAIEPEELE